MRRTTGIPYSVYAAQCPTRQALDRIADKWTALIVGLLGLRAHRFGELRRGVEVSRIGSEPDAAEPRARRPRAPHALATKPLSVEYSLTPLGATLVQPLAAIRDWAEQHIEAVQAARDAYVPQKPSSTPRQRDRR
jgi:DNA-binding HxlR family transcriptional regulator